MRLLIIGAGGHGHVVKEIAEDLGYTEVAFLDDNSPLAIGKVADKASYLEAFKEAFVGIGSNTLRQTLIDELQALGFVVPVLIHPTAYVSKSAILGAGTVVEPKAIVNANTNIGKGCIISVGAIVDHNVEIKDCVHINAGAIVKAGASVEVYTRIDAGEVVKGY